MSRRGKPLAQKCCGQQGNADADDTCGPAEAVKDLTKHGRTHEPTGKIAREVEPASGSAAMFGGAANVARRQRLGEERARGYKRHAE